jgi:catechol 2,3-dioxygenase-like lactoylglutathione lyase family enzyme
MNVTNLDSVTFGITDFAACRRFWTDFGLTESTAPDGAIVFSCKNGSSVVLRDANDATLPQPIEPGATQREAVFGVQSAADLSAIAAELERDRPVRIDADGTVHATDPLGFGIAFRVAQRKPVTAPELKFNTPGRPDRINTRGEFLSRPRHSK